MEYIKPYLISQKTFKSEFNYLQKICLTSENFSIGRGLDNSVVIPFIIISRNHCIFRKTNEIEWFVEDYSTFGITINGTKLGRGQTRRLTSEDIICLEDSQEFIYKFINCMCETDFHEVPSKKRRTVETYDYINSENNEDKIQNIKEMQAASANLKQQLHLDMHRKQEEIIINEKIKIFKRFFAIAKSFMQAKEKEVKDLKKRELKLEKELDESKKKIEILQQIELQRQNDQLLNEQLQEQKKVMERDNTKLIHEKEELQKKLADAELTSRKSIENTSEKLIDIMDSELQCIICADLFVSPITLSCSHTFCKYCITVWKRTKRECPICRAHIVTECETKVIDNVLEKMVNYSSDEMKERRSNILKSRNEELRAREREMASLCPSTSGIGRPWIELPTSDAFTSSDLTPPGTSSSLSAATSRPSPSYSPVSTFLLDSEDFIQENEYYLGTSSNDYNDYDDVGDDDDDDDDD